MSMQLYLVIVAMDPFIDIVSKALRGVHLDTENMIKGKIVDFFRHKNIHIGPLIDNLNRSESCDRIPKCVLRIPNAVTFLAAMKARDSGITEQVQCKVRNIVYDICEQIMEERDPLRKLPEGMFILELHEHLHAENFITETLGDTESGDQSLVIDIIHCLQRIS